MAYKILTTTSSYGKVDPAPLALLEAEGFEVTVNPYGRKLSVEESQAILKDYDGLIAGTESLNAAVLGCG